VYYWKNAQGEEVNFIMKQDNGITALIQVCADLTGEMARSRKTRALLKASRDLPCDNLLLLTETEDKTEETEWFGIKGTVRYIPLWKWLENPETGISGNAAD